MHPGSLCFSVELTPVTYNHSVLARIRHHHPAYFKDAHAPTSGAWKMRGNCIWHMLAMSSLSIIEDRWSGMG